MKKKFLFKVMNGRAPEYIKDLFRPKEQITSLVLHDNGNKLAVLLHKTDCLKHPLATLWSNPPEQFAKISTKCDFFFKLAILRFADVLLILQ